MKTIYTVMAHPLRVTISDGEEYLIQRGVTRVSNFLLEDKLSLVLSIPGLGRDQTRRRLDLVAEVSTWGGAKEIKTQIGSYNTDGLYPIHDEDFTTLPRVYFDSSFLARVIYPDLGTHSPWSVLSARHSSRLVKSLLGEIKDDEEHKELADLCSDITKGREQFDELVRFRSRERGL
jgi:hypothetical protein